MNLSAEHAAEMDQRRLLTWAGYCRWLNTDEKLTAVELAAMLERLKRALSRLQSRDEEGRE